MSIIVTRNHDSKIIDGVNLDFRSSIVLWGGEPAESDVVDYKASQHGTDLKIVRALISHKLGQNEYYTYLKDIWNRQKQNNKLCNKNVRKLFGSGPNEEGRFVDLFEMLPNQKMIIRNIIDHLTIQIRDQIERGYSRASDSAMSAILSGIETSKGTFIPQPFEGSLTIDAVDGKSLETGRPIPRLPVCADKTISNSTEANRKSTNARPPETPTDDDESAIEHVVDNVIKEIEKILNRRQVLRQFIADSTTRFIENRAGHWCVTDEVRGRGFKLEPILEGIADRLDDIVADTQDWRALGEIAGGLAVLGLDRSWVARHVGNARNATAEFQSYDEIIGVGDDRYINLLHLVSCGLADGMARLEKLFGEPPLDDRRLPDTAVVNMGSMPADIEKEIKLFLIRNLLGRRERVVATNDNRVKIQFAQVKRKFATAFKNHVPHYGSGPQYRQLTNLIRTDLEVEDLLLIFPSGDDPELDDPELLVSDNMSVFESLGRIFDAVQANTGMQS